MRGVFFWNYWRSGQWPRNSARDAHCYGDGGGTGWEGELFRTRAVVRVEEFVAVDKPVV